MDISPEPTVERIGIVPQRPSVIRLEQDPTKVSITVLKWTGQHLRVRLDKLLAP